MMKTKIYKENNLIKSMNNHKILFLVLGLFLVSFASAEINELADVKQFDCINVPQTCSSCSYVNVTILLPNKTRAVINEPMINEGGGVWGYEFCDTRVLGRHDVLGSGDLEGVPTSFDILKFSVTPSGFTLSLGFYFLILIISIGIVWFGFHIQDNWVIVLGGFAMVLIGLFIMFYGIDGFKDEVYTWGLSIITLMLGCYFGIRGAYEALFA